MTRKIFAVILAALMMFSGLSVLAGAALKPGSKYPTIYVPGRNEDNLVNDVAAANPLNIRADININVSQFAAVLGPKITSALTSGNWNGYCTALRSLISPMFETVRLDKNGNKKDNSGVLFTFGEGITKNYTQMDYTYKIDTYRFEYDYRISPLDNAAILNDYIECVKTVTGAKKVNLLGRCEGSNIVTAYLAEYGNPAEIESILFAWPSVYGLSGITSFFTGNISLDPDTLEVNLAVDSSSDSLLASIVGILNMTSAMDTSANAFNRIYGKVKNQLMPDLVLDTFGTMPSFWSMLSPDRYEEAKAFVFEGKETEYAGLIEKIDDYNDKVGSRLAEILKSYTDAGVKFSNVVKYGYPASSLCEDYRYEMTDGMATVTSASMGATAAGFGKTLSDSYIAERTAQGKGAYISPDKIIDASTCLYPDSTWFVKNVKHASMPAVLEDFCASLLASSTQPTVYEDGRYPQYLLYDGRAGVLAKLTVQNDIDRSDVPELQGGIAGFFAKIKAFFKSLMEKIKSLFS